MVEAVISQLGLFKALVASCSKLCADGVFAFTNAGLAIRSVDGSHISMLDLKLDRKAFEQYNLTTKAKDGVLELNVNFRMLSKILSKCNLPNIFHERHRQTRGGHMHCAASRG